MGQNDPKMNEGIGSEEEIRCTLKNRVQILTQVLKNENDIAAASYLAQKVHPDPLICHCRAHPCRHDFVLPWNIFGSQDSSFSFLSRSDWPKLCPSTSWCGIIILQKKNQAIWPERSATLWSILDILLHMRSAIGSCTSSHLLVNRDATIHKWNIALIYALSCILQPSTRRSASLEILSHRQRKAYSCLGAYLLQELHRQLVSPPLPLVGVILKRVIQDDLQRILSQEEEDRTLITEASADSLGVMANWSHWLLLQSSSHQRREILRSLITYARPSDLSHFDPISLPSLNVSCPLSLFKKGVQKAIFASSKVRFFCLLTVPRGHTIAQSPHQQDPDDYHDSTAKYHPYHVNALYQALRLRAKCSECEALRGKCSHWELFCFTNLDESNHGLLHKSIHIRTTHLLPSSAGVLDAPSDHLSLPILSGWWGKAQYFNPVIYPDDIPKDQWNIAFDLDLCIIDNPYHLIPEDAVDGNLFAVSSAGIINDGMDQRGLNTSVMIWPSKSLIHSPYHLLYGIHPQPNSRIEDGFDILFTPEQMNRIILIIPRFDHWIEGCSAMIEGSSSLQNMADLDDLLDDRVPSDTLHPSHYELKALARRHVIDAHGLDDLPLSTETRQGCIILNFSGRLKPWNYQPDDLRDYPILEGYFPSNPEDVWDEDSYSSEGWEAEAIRSKQ